MKRKQPRRPRDAPDPAAAAEEARRQAEFDAAWHVAQVRAARLIEAHAAPLIGVDMRLPTTTAEMQVARGEDARLEVVAAILMYTEATDEDVWPLVTAEGPHGSDRMVAAWWDGLWWLPALRPGTTAADAVAKLCGPLESLCAERIVRPEALDVIRGAAADPHADERRRGREEIARVRARIHALAREEEAN